MTKLVIVESPAKAKTISRFLGKEYKVTASFGHIRDLPGSADEVPAKIKGKPWSSFAVDIENDFTPYYVIPKGKKKYVDSLKKDMKDAEELLLATDEDREGESISWHLLEILKPKIPVKRIVFHEITREAINEALANPRDVDENLVHAQESRRILDRLYGYTLSPVLWKRVAPKLSAGRVQSVALRLIAEREEERRAFVSSIYWGLEAQLSSGKSSFKATFSQYDGKRVVNGGKDFDPATGKLTAKNAVLLDEAEAQRLQKELEAGLPWRVASVEEKPATQRPAPPFITSTLQQEANRKLGYSSRRTMQIAQGLYEGIDIGGGERTGLITYMRTDSVSLSEKALKDAQDVILKSYGPDYAQGPRRYKTKQRNAQEAHESIRPTEISRTPQSLKQYLKPEEFRLYELIWKRAIASQMPDAKLKRTSVELLAQDSQKKEAVFSLSGKTILFPGFLRAYVEGSDDPEAELGDKETILPPLSEGDKITGPGEDGKAFLDSLDARRSETQPPARYTEASLVKKLEEEGVGRPSTYASIISTVQDRGYVITNKSKALIPTFTGMIVTDLLRRHFPEYVELAFTARMEEELDEIANGRLKWIDHVREFYRGGGSNGKKQPGLELKVKAEEEKISSPAMGVGVDEETNQQIYVRIGRYGPYVLRGEGGEGNVANVPEDVPPAEFTVEMAKTAFAKKKEGPREVGTDPESGLMVYAANGRFGPYVQLGETPEGKTKEKPKRASIPKGMSEEEITLEQALHLLALPRELGVHPDSGEPVLANIGRYGPYVNVEKDFRSIPDGESPYTITFERALELLREPKGKRGAAKKEAIQDFGEHDGKKLQVLSGRYGPYVTDGKVNATIPKKSDPESLTKEQAIALLEAKKK